MTAGVIDAELPEDVFHFSTLSSSSSNLEIAYSPDLSRNELGREPKFPNHGQYSSVYAYLPISQRIRRCFYALGAQAEYDMGIRVRKCTIDNSQCEYETFNTFLIKWSTGGGNYVRGNLMSFSRMIVCLRDPAFTGTIDDIDSGNIVQYDIVLQSGRSKTCNACNPNLYGHSNPARSTSSSFIYGNPVLTSGSQYIPLSFSRQTDNSPLSQCYVKNEPGEAWYFDFSLANNCPPRRNAWGCKTRWQRISGGPVYYTDAYEPPRDTDLLITLECYQGRTVNNDERYSAFARTFANAGLYEYPTVCYLDRFNHYDVYCVDSGRSKQFAELMVQYNPQNPASEARIYLQRVNNPNSIFPSGDPVVRAKFEELKLVRKNRLRYQSPNWALTEFFSVASKVPPNIKQYWQPPLPERVPEYPSSIAFWRLFVSSISSWIHEPIESIMASSPTLISAYQRRSENDFFERDCPAILDARIACNIKTTNENVCVAGQCMCDENWLGIGCHIPYPTHPGGARFSVEEVIRASAAHYETNGTDLYQICSTAGAPIKRVDVPYYSTTGSPKALTVTTLASLPICACKPGFGGTPEDLGEIQLFASKFISAIVGQQLVRRRSGDPERDTCYNAYQWADTVMNAGFAEQNLIRRMSLSDVCPRPDGKKYTATFPWQDKFFLNQCYIWKANMTLPSLAVRFDAVGTVLSLRETGSYTTKSVMHAPPAFSDTGPYFPREVNPYATGNQGVQCWDYRLNGINWTTESITATNPPYYGEVVKYMQWLLKDPRFEQSTVRASLYGGDLCRPCPDCNRSNSVCVDQRPVTETSTTYCHCNLNYCGTTCNVTMCPSANGKICGFGTCTTTTQTATICNAGRADGAFAGTCVCQTGYSGANCSTPVCPVNPSTGELCSGPSKGTCNVVSRQCDCNPAFGGPFCGRTSCPRNPVSGLECSGVTIPGTTTSVCDSTVNPPVCQCYQTTPGIFDLATRDTTLSELGWPQEVSHTVTRIYVNGTWGIACERTFSEVCQDESGYWCSQPFTSSGVYATARSPGYAGCYNRTCLLAGTASAGWECRPSCKCTTEYTTVSDPSCGTSVCGNTRCDVSFGLDTGQCNVWCTVTGQSQTSATKCMVPAITDKTSSINLNAQCICKVANGTYWAKSSGVDMSVDQCDQPAPACFSGAVSPCSGNGQCLYNETTTNYTCVCNPGYSGNVCQTPPACLTPSGALCNGAYQFCAKYSESAPAVCACRRSYLRNSSRLCTYDACTATGGTVNPDFSCSCPGGAPFFENVPYWPPVADQTAIGCRKQCPIDNSTGVECGALEVTVDSSGRNVRRSRCIDLLTNTPVFRNTTTPSPICSCYFRGLDYRNKTNYFINSTVTAGACVPKCNPDGLCSGSECKGRGTLSNNNDCICGPNWKGDTCHQVVCNKNPLVFDQDTCLCKQWCLGGSECTVDLCAASGGVCAGSNPNDCDCSGNPYLQLDVSSGATSRRYCTGRCLNGGTLNSDKSGCICPFPFYGDLCQNTAECPYQWSGVYCNISNCENGGTPRGYTELGCTCSDTYYQGPLCQYDFCSVTGQSYRNGSGACVCSPGYTGSSCQVAICGPGGNWDASNSSCSCLIGYYLASNRSLCILDPNFEQSCVNGKFQYAVDGSLMCSCNFGYTGRYCDQTACTSPQIPLLMYTDGTVVCGCPFALTGAGCRQSLCTGHASGTEVSPLDNRTYCVCLPGYEPAATADSNGVFQCVPSYSYCYANGTAQQTVNGDTLTCQCKSDFTGSTCLESTDITPDVIEVEVCPENDANLLKPPRIVPITVTVAALIIIVTVVSIMRRSLLNLQARNGKLSALDL